MLEWGSVIAALAWDTASEISFRISQRLRVPDHRGVRTLLQVAVLGVLLFPLFFLLAAAAGAVAVLIHG